MECLRLICPACDAPFYWPATERKYYCPKCESTTAEPARLTTGPNLHNRRHLEAQQRLPWASFSALSSFSSLSSLSSLVSLNRSIRPDIILPGPLLVIEPIVDQSHPDIYRSTLKESDPTRRTQLPRIEDITALQEALQAGSERRQSVPLVPLRTNRETQPDSQTAVVGGVARDDHRPASHGTEEGYTESQYSQPRHHPEPQANTSSRRGRKGRKSRGHPSQCSNSNDREHDYGEEHERKPLLSR
ncbi:hypothetical protein SAMD00023353_0302240 [Rosellinia necatrix]|uniref:Uncharacterized protein n=1 Tax=Rosellinia necatrix TaxID=77044 RepID=A0A1W2TDL5_ROSNE|nr:hypothetical protein SAMD00023353_0302240 [Rosellinia necatrix]